MKKHNILIIIVLSIVGIIAQCKSDKKENPNTVEVIETIQISDTIGNYIYILPSPNEILEEISINKLEINSSIVNPAINVSQYNDTRSQAINLGVYIADFAYLSYSAENTTDLEYLKVIKQLSEEVGMYNLIDEKILSRINDNLMNKDSLNIISQEFYYNLTDQLENSNRQNIFLLISSGTIIESLYLSVSLINNFDLHKEYVQKIYEQKFVFDNFYEYAKQYDEDIYVQKIIDHLDILNQIFDGLTEENEDPKVIKNEDSTLRFVGGSNFALDKKSFENFKSNIISLRNEIVSF